MRHKLLDLFSKCHEMELNVTGPTLGFVPFGRTIRQFRIAYLHIPTLTRDVK